MATKKTPKKIVVDMIVDLTDCADIADVYEAFACTRIDKHMMQEEVDVFVDRNMVSIYVHDCDCCVNCEPEKKLNAFTRFWNWITRKK